jgi:hypothetical protein
MQNIEILGFLVERKMRQKACHYANSDFYRYTRALERKSNPSLSFLALLGKLVKFA